MYPQTFNEERVLEAWCFLGSRPSSVPSPRFMTVMMVMMIMSGSGFHITGTILILIEFQPAPSTTTTAAAGMA